MLFGMQRKKLLYWTLLLVIVQAVWVPMFVRILLVRTRYAPAFSKQVFERVRPNEPLKNVLRSLGPPLSYRVVNNSDQPGRVLEMSTEVARAYKWRTNAGVLIYLHYSEPKEQDGNYKAYCIVIQGGVVMQALQFTHWD